mmetsp:Transcript_41660/g.99893  ORF Transcript_41660/g.99893 Transcript_41660/m.99893 type:complete len:215 (-) Transcript_41660:296-940(-)
MTRWAAAGLYPGASGRGVYLINCVFSSISFDVSALTIALPDGLFNAVFDAINFCNAAFVFSAVSSSSCAVGNATSSFLASPPRRSSYRVYTVLPEFVPPLTIASYEISPSLSTSTFTIARDCVCDPPAAAAVSPPLFPPPPPAPDEDEDGGGAFRRFKCGLPKCRGYCATWISGNAPPSSKSSNDRGTNNLIFFAFRWAGVNPATSAAALHRCS